MLRGKKPNDFNKSVTELAPSCHGFVTVVTVVSIVTVVTVVTELAKWRF